MMRNVFILMLMVTSLSLNGQVTFVAQLPPVAQVKNQLWNIAVTNTKQSAVLVYVDITFTDIQTGFQLFTASSNHVQVLPGTQVIQFTGWNPVQYNYTDPSADQLASGELLPVGQFLVCHRLMYFDGDGFIKLQEECQPVTIEPLSPPYLMYPELQDTITGVNPLFIWMGPTPSLNQYTGDYDLQVAEVQAGQSPADAMLNNIPLLFITAIKGTSYLSDGKPALEAGKNYAWRILARERNTVVAQSEVWTFTVLDTAAVQQVTDRAPYHKLSKNGTAAYAVIKKVLKFEYENMLKDTTWDIKVIDISDKAHREIKLDWESMPMKPGLNYVTIPLDQTAGFKNKHIYHLKVFNRRNEVWELKFEYRDDK